MLKINIKDVLPSLEIISGLIDEAELKFSKDGLNIKEADRTMVSIVDLSIKASAFDVYNFEKNFKVKINLVELITIFKRFKDERVSLSVENEKFVISGTNKLFKMPLISGGSSEFPNVKEIEKKFIVKDLEIKYEDLKDAITDSDLIADSLIIEKDNNLFRITASGNSTEYQKEIAVDYKLGNEISAIGRYSLDYLKKMFKRELSEEVKLSFGKDFPLKLVFEADDYTLKIILAPRVSETEEDEEVSDEEDEDETEETDTD